MTMVNSGLKGLKRHNQAENPRKANKLFFFLHNVIICEHVHRLEKLLWIFLKLRIAVASVPEVPFIFTHHQ